MARSRDLAHQVSGCAGVPIRMTWCVRSDAQMRMLYGDSAWPYKAFAATWEALAADGDEIAWHPHVWRWDEVAHCWYQEIGDELWIAECLCEGHWALSEVVGEGLQTSRMGWEFHTNYTMRTVAGLGVANDCSAIPGWYAAGEASHGSRFHCYADWRLTPRRPYRPSRVDYRLAATGSGDALGIRELPMSTFVSGLWGGVRAVRKALRLRGLRGLGVALNPNTWRAAQIKAYVTIRPAIFRQLIAEQLRGVHSDPQGRGYLLTAFHPDELLSDDPALLYSAAHFEANLRAIFAMARAEGVEPVFVTVAGLSRVLPVW